MLPSLQLTRHILQEQYSASTSILPHVGETLHNDSMYPECYTVFHPYGIKRRRPGGNISHRQDYQEPSTVPHYSGSSLSHWYETATYIDPAWRRLCRDSAFKYSRDAAEVQNFHLNGDVNITINILQSPSLNQDLSRRLLSQLSTVGSSAPSHHVHEMAALQSDWLVEQDELADLAWALSLSESDSSQALASTRSLSPKAERASDRARRGLINFKKTWMYANSRLQPYMPPLVVYMPTWRLLCLAAQASLSVYDRPRGDEKEHFIAADWHHSTKAMVLKSRPIDDQNVIVFAIRGSKMNFVDWSINFRPEPTSLTGFLDDGGNACHAGFLTVAKAMIRPVAARLRQLLEQNPSRASSSLLITGHSAGGAVAALLYVHMLSQTVDSELCDLAGCFKRIHCITFGAPPVTLLPLHRPISSRNKKNIFMSVVNEGDPVARAEKAYVVSLAKLLAAPEPRTEEKKLSSKRLLSLTKNPRITAPHWPLPEAILCNAGSIIVIRQRPGSIDTVEAIGVGDDDMRSVLFGDPAMHSMRLYKDRIDQLAFSEVTGANAR